MGGWGSGRQTDRRTAEGMYRIDLAQLRQMGILSCEPSHGVELVKRRGGGRKRDGHRLTLWAEARIPHADERWRLVASRRAGAVPADGHALWWPSPVVHLPQVPQALPRSLRRAAVPLSLLSPDSLQLAKRD